MLLENKTAVIYGAGGAIGGAVARGFAREGARVFLAGRTAATLDVVAEEIVEAGGTAETAEVDALDEAAVDRYVDALAAKAGGVDVSFSAISTQDVQLVPFVDISPEDFGRPIQVATRTHFLTGRAAARHMMKQGSGVILTLSSSAVGPPPPADIPIGGFGVACSAVEAMTTTMAAELGPSGIRVVCLRPEGIPESWVGKSTDDWSQPSEDVETMLKEHSLLRRVTTLADLANAAAFLASDRASAMTATVANLTSGTVVG
jgi:NAD(P)-dependent dehydrogenase (short-subunit alcohol dehydrogenase family)